MKITETKNGAIIEIFVKPNQPKFNIKIDGDEIIVFCTEEPVKGKVNKELIKELSKLFHTQIEIVSGLTSKQKRLLVKNISKKEAENLLHTENLIIYCASFQNYLKLLYIRELYSKIATAQLNHVV